MDGNSSIDLDERTDGDISCSVKNHVSQAQKNIRLKPCPGLEVRCSFNQSDPCYAALEHKLNLLMERDAREYDLKIIKRINNTQDDPICRVKYGRKKECDLYNNRIEVNIINATVIINRVIREDSGNYRLLLFHSDGTETSRDLQVIVEVLKFSLIALGCVALILILLFITICYVYKKKQLKWKPAAAGETELIYADISHEKKSEKKNT
ncbi:hypothetical protein cypCar_00043827, partial [Cyprinus carpio]